MTSYKSWLTLGSLVTIQLLPLILISSMQGFSICLFLGSMGAILALFSMREHKWAVPMKVLGHLVLLLFNSMLLLSVRYHGGDFDDAFFYHFSWNTLVTAFSFFPKKTAQGLVLIGVALWLARRAPSVTQRFSPKISLLMFLISVIGTAPALSLGKYFMDGREEMSDRLYEMAIARSPHVSRKMPKEPRDVILIYAESFERTYFNEKAFGPITPQLKKLASEGMDFTNLSQFPGTGWTIAGMVASQCGLPLLSHVKGNRIMERMHSYLGGFNCLGDLLKEQGYQTTYMGGAGLEFAGKGHFLKRHGYERALGKDELLPRLDDPEYLNNWGLHDDSLFDFAWQELNQHRDQEDPLFLTLLTLDTHGPKGHIPTACKDFKPELEPMKRALACSDKLLSEFVEQLRQDQRYKDALIVIASDHLAMRNPLWNELTRHEPERRLALIALGEGIEPQKITKAGTHFDIAPTLLELMGHKGFGQFPFGQSLLSHEAGLAHSLQLDEEDFEGFDLIKYGFKREELLKQRFQKVVTK